MTSQPKSTDQRDEVRRREAADTLRRLAGENNLFIGSTLAKTARRALTHFAGRDGFDSSGLPPDRIEQWGRRIGRAFSLIVFIGLGLYLYLTYVAGRF